MGYVQACAISWPTTSSYCPSWKHSHIAVAVYKLFDACSLCKVAALSVAPTYSSLTVRIPPSRNDDPPACSRSSALAFPLLSSAKRLQAILRKKTWVCWCLKSSRLGNCCRRLGRAYCLCRQGWTFLEDYLTLEDGGNLLLRNFGNRQPVDTVRSQKTCILTHVWDYQIAQASETWNPGGLSTCRGAGRERVMQLGRSGPN